MPTAIDLTPYVAKGFPGEYDKGIAEVGVGGIDREQTLSLVRLCDETVDTLYSPEYSPTRIKYHKGARPDLEKIVEQFDGATPTERARQAMHWVATKVVHPHHVGPTPPDRALTEEGLIESECGYCNEQARVFIGLCEVMEIPARLLFLFHANEVCGHTIAEAYLDGRWVMFDITFDVVVTLPDGRLAEGRDLCGDNCHLAHDAYREPMKEYNARALPYVENIPGWKSSERPKVESAGDLLKYMGICNYLIDGVEAV
jgi:transglutaminase-like putative cysteine protease